MTEYADNAQTEAAKKQYAAEREIAEQVRAEYASRMKGRPTPTQEEIDHSMLGAHILNHEDDGSGPDLGQRALEAGKRGDYQTRQVTAVAGQHRAPAPPHRAPPRAE